MQSTASFHGSDIVGSYFSQLPVPSRKYFEYLCDWVVKRFKYKERSLADDKSNVFLILILNHIKNNNSIYNKNT